MTYEFFMKLFYVFIGVSALFLLISVLLFFMFRIPSVIGYLSGSTAKKAIKDIHEQIAVNGNAYKQSSPSSNRKSFTDEIKPSTTEKSSNASKKSKHKKAGNDNPTVSLTEYEKNLIKNQQFNSNETEVLDSSSYNQGNDYYNGNNETEVLNYGSGNTINNSQPGYYENDNYESNETSLLTQNQDYNNETTVLRNNDSFAPDNSYNSTRISNGYVIIKDITFVHTNESIM